MRNRTGIEDWILEKARYRRDETDPEFLFPYDLGALENIKQVADWSCAPIGDGINWKVRGGCDQYTLTVNSPPALAAASAFAHRVDAFRRNKSLKRLRSGPGRGRTSSREPRQARGCHFGRKACVCPAARPAQTRVAFDLKSVTLSKSPDGKSE